jgi:cytochrome c oxidase subunit 2
VKNIILPAILLLMGLLVACSSTGTGPEAGQNLSVTKGCAACHAVDETSEIRPTWVGLYGLQVELNDGNFVTADEAYMVESIKKPNAKIVQGYT